MCNNLGAPKFNWFQVKKITLSSIVVFSEQNLVLILSVLPQLNNVTIASLTHLNLLNFSCLPTRGISFKIQLPNLTHLNITCTYITKVLDFPFPKLRKLTLARVSYPKNLPTTLTHLKLIWAYTDDRIFTHMTNLKKLYVDNEWLCPICTNITHLNFGPIFKYPWFFLPETLTHLIFDLNSVFNQSPQKFPKSLVYLHFGRYFSHPIHLENFPNLKSIRARKEIINTYCKGFDNVEKIVIIFENFF